MIRIYQSQDVAEYLDTTDARTLVCPYNRRSGNPVIKQIFIQNTDTSKWAANVSVYATSSGLDIYSGTNGYGIKFYYGDLKPTERIWSAIPYNNPVLINNIGTTGSADTSFKSIWMRCEAPAMADIKAYPAIVKADYVEEAV